MHQIDRINLSLTSSSSFNYRFKKTMAEVLTPSLKLKTNELFYKWLTESDRNDQLKDLIDLIKNGKVTKLNELQACFKVN